MLKIDFSGKVAVLTGAGGVIVGGIARRLADAGAKIYLTDVNLTRLKENEEMLKQYNPSIVELDVANDTQVNKVFDDIAAKEGSVDILVNGAGIGYTLDVYQSTTEQFTKTLDINLVGTYNCMMAALKYMKPKKDGKIVNIGSASSRRAAPGIAHYSASKQGVIGITQAFALAAAVDNININSVCPGIIVSPLTEELFKSLSDKMNITYEQARGVFLSRIAFGRFQTGEDIGDAVAFLCSELAKNITGQALNVDGAMNMN